MFYTYLNKPYIIGSSQTTYIDEEDPKKNFLESPVLIIENEKYSPVKIAYMEFSIGKLNDIEFSTIKLNVFIEHFYGDFHGSDPVKIVISKKSNYPLKKINWKDRPYIDEDEDRYTIDERKLVKTTVKKGGFLNVDVTGIIQRSLSLGKKYVVFQLYEMGFNGKLIISSRNTADGINYIPKLIIET